MIREDFKTEIVCILNNKLEYAKDDSDLLDLYWVIAEEICKYIDEEKK